ncbi:MAG: queuosine precursor transporter [Thermoplasmata archaeon]
MKAFKSDVPFSEEGILVRKEILYASIGALYVTAQVLTAIRVESFPLFPKPYDLVPAGVMAYLAIFVVANIINEKEGREEGWRIIAAGLFANLLFLINLYLEFAVPEAKGVFPDFTSQTMSWLASIEVRIIVGSIIAFLVAMYLNNHLYHRWKWNIWGKYTIILIVVMAVDTAIFHTIAYAGIFTFEGLLGSIASVTAFKMILTVLSIPVFAFGLRAYGWRFSLEKKEERIAGTPGV